MDWSIFGRNPVYKLLRRELIYVHHIPVGLDVRLDRTPC